MNGALIVESLRVGAEFALPLRMRRMSRFEVEDATPEQPQLWTLLEFEADDRRAQEVAAAFAGSLSRTGGWYVDFHTAEAKYVVFADRVFRFQRGDRLATHQAQEYARSVGVPESQLDWAE